MAVQVESKGQLQEFLDVLRRRRWQVILPAALVVSIGALVAVIVPKKYVVKTQIELRPVGVSISTKEAGNAPFQIRTQNRIKKVVQKLENREYLALQPIEQNEFLVDIAADLKVTLGKGATEGSNFVTIEYSDVALAWAMDFTRRLRDDWIEDVVERDRKKSDDEVRKLLDEKQKLEKLLAREEQGLTDLRRAHNLSATQPIPGSTSERTEDPVFERLRRNEAEKEAVESALARLAVTISTAKRRYDELPPNLARSQLVPAVSNEAELKDVEQQIFELSESLRGIKPANSHWKIKKDKIAGLERRRAELARLVTKGSLEETTVPNPELAPRRKEIEKLEDEQLEKLALVKKLEADIARDQARVDELQEVYREMRERQELITRYSATLNDAERRYRDKQAENQLLGSALAVPFEITQEVTSSGKPTEPNPWLIVSFAIFAGLGIGLGLALLGEYSKSCFRSVADITRVMVVPVLGRIDAIVTRREARTQRMRRAAVGLSSALFVVAITFVTWAWAKSPDLLSQGVRDAIENLRTKMR